MLILIYAHIPNMLQTMSFAVMFTYIESREIDLSIAARDNQLKGIISSKSHTRRAPKGMKAKKAGMREFGNLLMVSVINLPILYILFSEKM